VGAFGERVLHLEHAEDPGQDNLLHPL
jgi:hypothetical protein